MDRLGSWVDVTDVARLAMALTHDFKTTVRARAQTDREFRDALLNEVTEALRSSDVDTGKAILRDFIEASASNSMLRPTHRQRS